MNNPTRTQIDKLSEFIAHAKREIALNTKDQWYALLVGYFVSEGLEIMKVNFTANPEGE